jgi:hypothetical protein
MADARLAHCASCCKSEAHRGLQRQGRTTQWRDVYGMFMERWVESGLCKRVCQGAILLTGEGSTSINSPFHTRRVIVCALDAVSPRDLWWCVLPRGQFNMPLTNAEYYM